MKNIKRKINKERILIFFFFNNVIFNSLKNIKNSFYNIFFQRKKKRKIKN
jgi:hypothetical protein